MAQPDITVDQITAAPAFDGTNITNVAKESQSIITVGGSRALLIGDANNYLRCTSAGSTVLTVPTNASVAFPNGTHVDIHRASGTVSVAAAGGVTVNTAETLILRKTHSTATLIKVGTNEWDLVGDLRFV